MNRRSFLSAVAVNLVGAGVVLFAMPLARAADPAQRVVRVGFVSPLSPSTELRVASALWERLRLLALG